MLTDTQRVQSVASIVRLQIDSGLILWVDGGHADPWNHVETAMALDVGGENDRATKAYAWLAANQCPDGSWHQYYEADRVKDAKFDANTIAYVAVGVWHHFLTTNDRSWLQQQWPMVLSALSWVLQLQQPTGEVFWAREPDGTPFHYALITGSSSIHHSLNCAIAIATELRAPTEVLAEARNRLGYALRHHSLEFFAEKDRWAMDWYYPVLGGVMCGDDGIVALKRRWEDFVIDGHGVRCVNDHPWVTTGETAEAAIACAMLGMHNEARLLLDCTNILRHDDGSYWTGLHVPSGTWFPEGERTAYSAAAVLLADAIVTDSSSPTARAFGIGCDE
jgi:hypothetical protein